MLDFSVDPGLGLGEFKLGMALAEAIQVTNTLARNKLDPFNRVDVIYCKNEPLVNPIVLKYDQGFKLQFHPVSQTLEQIEIYNTAPLMLSYRGENFCNPENPPTYTSLFTTFGPTIPGDFDRVNGKLYYFLNYPGMSLQFSIPKDLEILCSDNDIEVLPPECAYVPLETLVLKQSTEFSRIIDSLPPLIEATLGEGIKVGNAKIRFGDSPQDVLCELGSPEAINIKKDNDNLMRLHNGLENMDIENYFYNYFSIGLDILFNGYTHKIEKFIFHTNFPSHYEFNCYTKSNFNIHLPDEFTKDAPKKIQAKPVASAPKPQGVVMIGDDEDDEVSNEEDNSNVNQEEFKITPNTSWKEIQDYLGIVGRPLIFNSPAGPTKIYGYKGLALEVLQNGYLGNVFMFRINKVTN